MLNLAGFVGVDPSPFTYYELAMMARGKHKEEWQHTASVIAMIANTARDPKKQKKAFSAEDFYPKCFLGVETVSKKKQASEKFPISILKTAFIDNPHVNWKHQGRQGDHRGQPGGRPV